MIPRRLRIPPEHLYPDDEWRVVERGFDERWLGNAETIFSLSNGFIGIRGSHEEARPAVESGTFLNGFHETWPILHAEQAYGFAQTGQTIVNVPDVSILKLYVDDEPLFLPTARLLYYERTLDMRTGVLTRDLCWSTPGGKHVRVRSTRMVSLVHRHLGVMTLEIEVDTDAPIVVSSQLFNRQDGRALDEERGNGSGADPRRARMFQTRVLNARTHHADDLTVVTGYQTTHSRMTMSAGMHHVLRTENDCATTTTWSEDLGKVVFTAQARSGVPITIEKYFTYHTSRNVPAAELVDRGRRSLQRAVELGVEGLRDEQCVELAAFWERADVRIRGPERQQQAVRWNLFQLHQASARAETAGIPAKGLTGQAYEGHYFWDTEIYVAPFLTYTEPRITRNLLRFRASMLEQARDRARELSERGALFPWRTINGEEASSYYAAGTAQYHINADIAYAIKRYVDVRGDTGLLMDLGAEILVETARMWVGLGFVSPKDDRFHIHGVTGPDEYTTVVNDNAFTNLMARRNLRFAMEALTALAEDEPEEYARLAERLDLRPEEVRSWARCADAMYIPFDSDRGIHPQDANFLEKEVWDFASTPSDHYPLLLHYHPLVIYRHQVLKQADVVLAMVLLGDEFTIEQKRRNFDYYDPLTTGDSSLSACVQSILAAEIGYEEQAVDYFRYALLMDLADVAGNVVDGVHVASAGGVWMALTYGFAGLRDYGGRLSFDPRLPSSWDGISFRLRFQDRSIAVDLSKDLIVLELLDGEPSIVSVRDEVVELRLRTPHRFDVPSRWLPPDAPERSSR